MQISFVLVLVIDSGLSDRSTFEKKKEIYDSENEEKKTIEYSFIRKMTHVAVPQILLSTKLSHQSPGHMPGILEHRKDHVHYQNHASDVVLSSYKGREGGLFPVQGVLVAANVVV